MEKVSIFVLSGGFPGEYFSEMPIIFIPGLLGFLGELSYRYNTVPNDLLSMKQEFVQSYRHVVPFVFS